MPSHSPPGWEPTEITLKHEGTGSIGILLAGTNKTATVRNLPCPLVLPLAPRPYPGVTPGPGRYPFALPLSAHAWPLYPMWLTFSFR